MKINKDVFFYDAHAHDIKKQSGGFIIGTEGITYSTSKVLTNFEAYETCKRFDNFHFVEYITKDLHRPTSAFIKIHPRREQYHSKQIVSFLTKYRPKLIIIDTLNFPYWDVKDYWSLVRCLPESQFILAHCGGVEIRDFLKIVIFEKNVWCDFSLTQEFYGYIDSKKVGLLDNEINWCFENSKVLNKILFGSDEPYFSQDACLIKMIEIGKLEILNNNYENLLLKIR